MQTALERTADQAGSLLLLALSLATALATVVA